MPLSRKGSKPRRRSSSFGGNQWTRKAKNRPEVDDDAADANLEILQETQPDASACKLSEFLQDDSDNELEGDETDNEDDGERRLIEYSHVNNLLASTALCAFCREATLAIVEVRRQGLVPIVRMACSSCGMGNTASLGTKGAVGSHYDLNRRSVLAMRCIGKGYASMKLMFSVMGLPCPMSRSTFYDHHKVMCASIATVASDSMDKAAIRVIDLNRMEDHPDRIPVTIDGTWMERGFSSLYGVVFVVTWQTGQVVDYCVLSKHCAKCKHWKAKRRRGAISQEEYAAWKSDHQPECDINTASSAPGMETEGVRRLFRRSQERNLVYTSYIGDGDSKGYQAVLSDKPYGDVEIVKEECIGHVAKRLGKALRDLKKNKAPLADGKPIGGKGRLTEERCEKLQKYFSLAIQRGVKQPGDPVNNMMRHIWASLAHSASTDEHPQHEFCPTDEGSFCKWQQWKAGRQGPYTHHDPLPEAVVDAIKPAYRRLASPALLVRCSRGATQNQNESLNGLVWQYCPKTSFCGVDTVEAAVGLALIKFNHGLQRFQDVLAMMGCVASADATAGLVGADRERLYFSKRKHSEEEKQERKRRRRQRKGLEEDTVEKEGAMYVSGGW